MVFQPSFRSRLLVGDFHSTPKVAQVAAPALTDMLDVTTLVDQEPVFIPGLETSTYTVSGFLDTDASANQQFDQLNDWVTAEPVTWAPRGLALGSEVQLVNSLKTQFGTEAQVAGAVQFSLDCQTDGLVDFGVSLRDLSASTADDLTPASHDGGASSANGGVGHLHVTAYTGLTNVVVKIQDSTDDAVFVDLITFDTVTGLTAQRSAVAGTVNRYLRYSLDVTGTGSITCQVGFARR